MIHDLGALSVAEIIAFAVCCSAMVGAMLIALLG